MSTLDRLRAICLALPEVTERPSHSAPTWFVRGKSSFVTLWEGGHHDHHFANLWCAAGPGVQAELVESEPERFFRPPYVGGRGWVGVRLDVDVDWAELAEICRDATGRSRPRSWSPSSTPRQSDHRLRRQQTGQPRSAHRWPAAKCEPRAEHRFCSTRECLVWTRWPVPGCPA